MSYEYEKYQKKKRRKKKKNKSAIIKDCEIERMSDWLMSHPPNVTHLVVVVPVDEDGPLRAVGHNTGEVDG